MLWPEVIIPKIATLSIGPEPRPSCIIFCFTSHPCASCYHHFCLHQWVPPLHDVIVESSLSRLDMKLVWLAECLRAIHPIFCVENPISCLRWPLLAAGAHLVVPQVVHLALEHRLAPVRHSHVLHDGWEVGLESVCNNGGCPYITSSIKLHLELYRYLF